MRRRKILKWITRFSFLAICLLALSCSGYRFRSKTNPLAQFGIRSLTIPTFYNHSNISGVSSEFTKEFYKIMTQYKGLKVYTGHKDKVDAVLVGVIKSADKLKESYSVASYRLAGNSVKDELGRQRRDFKVPASSSISLFVKLYLIKNPSEEELSLLQTELADQIELSSKTIFVEKIDVSTSFSREVFSSEGKSTNFTQNRGHFKRNISTLAKNAANSFKEVVLYAF